MKGFGANKMSVDKNIYVGSYLEIENKNKKVKHTEDVLGCPKCNKPISFDFCPTCGTKRQCFEYVTMKTFDIFEALDEDEDEDLQDEYQYRSLRSSWFVSEENDLIGFDYENEFSYTIEEDENLHEENMPEKATEEDWGKIIKVLKKKKVKYKLRYGVVTYIN